MISRFLHISTTNLLILFLFIVQWQILFVRLDNDRIKNVIGSDGTGYYEYLPKTFIKKDYPFALPGTVKKEEVKPEQLVSITGGPVNKYFFGESLALLPFFLTADLLTQSLRPDMRDGYSSYYQISVSIAALFYLFLGLWMIHRLLRRMNYAQEIINLILILLFLGTNLNYYALHEPSMSHVYSFALIATFIDQIHLQLQSFKPIRWLFLAFLLSFIVFIRPVNIVVAFVLFPLAGSFKQSINCIKDLFSKPVIWFLSLLIPIVFIGIQATFYYLQTGHWWVYSYGEEGFNFSKPEIVNVLFSFRKGLFIYTPLLLLIFPGLYFYKKRFGLFSFISLTLLLAISIYIISSWWYWAYGGSFGMRPVIDLYPILILPIAALIEWSYARYFNFRIFGAIILLGVYLNLLQVWQYVQSIMPYEGMNRAKYAHIFLETKRHFRFIYPAETTNAPFDQYSTDIVYTLSANGPFQVGNQSNLPKNQDFIACPFNDILRDSTLPHCWLEIQGEFKLEDASSDASFITSIQNPETCWYWQRIYLIQYIDISDEWKRISVRIDLPDLQKPQDKFSVSLYNDSKTRAEARNVVVRLLKK
jgi:hypothetical protein